MLYNPLYKVNDELYMLYFINPVIIYNNNILVTSLKINDLRFDNKWINFLESFIDVGVKVINTYINNDNRFDFEVDVNKRCLFSYIVNFENMLLQVKLCKYLDDKENACDLIFREINIDNKVNVMITWYRLSKINSLDF